MEMNPINRPNLDFSGLVDSLKNEDLRNLRLTNRFQWMMFVLSPLYFILFVVGLLTDEPFYKHFGMIFFAIAFLVFAFIFRKYNKEYRSVDYGLPTVEMLEKAVKRYNFWQRKTILAVLPVVLVDIGMCFSNFDPFFGQEAEFLTRVLHIQAFFIPLMTVSFTIGYFIWRHRQKPIRDKAKELLQEIRA